MREREVLKRGQTSVGVRKKQAKLYQGLIERRHYLNNAISELRERSSLPDGCFLPAATKTAIREWHDPEKRIFRMSPGTFNRYPDLAEELLGLIRTIHRLLEKSMVRTKLKRSSRDIQRDLRFAKDRIQVLTDELCRLRRAYCDVLGMLESDEQIAHHRRHAIQRHRELYGRPRVVVDDE